MGTRGLCGFRVDGQDKLMYNHSDSYPSGLGVDVFNFVRGLKSVKEAAAKARSIVLLEETDENYSKYRAMQGDLAEMLRSGVMLDGHEFALDSLFCEWAYILDFDQNVLEVYRGFVKKQGTGRYDKTPRDEKKEFFGIHLLRTLSFDTVKALTEEDLGKLPRMLERLCDCTDVFGYTDPAENSKEVYDFFEGIEVPGADCVTQELSAKNVPFGGVFSWRGHRYLRIRNPSVVQVLRLTDYLVMEIEDRDALVEMHSNGL